MNIFSKIALSGKFGKGIYIISVIMTVAMGAVVVPSPISIPVCVILKLLSIPAIFYLFYTFSKKQELYFWLNLGISSKEYYIIPFAVEFIGFVLFMIICGNIGYAIQ